MLDDATRLKERGRDARQTKHYWSSTGLEVLDVRHTGIALPIESQLLMKSALTVMLTLFLSLIYSLTHAWSFCSITSPASPLIGQHYVSYVTRTHTHASPVQDEDHRLYHKVEVNYV
jgi:hypothetical protein